MSRLPSDVGSDGGASGGPASTTKDLALGKSNVVRQVEDYNRILSSMGTPNYGTIKKLLSGEEGVIPAETVPTIQVSFELFETVQNRFATTKLTLERTKEDLLTRNQQYSVLQRDMHSLQEEHSSVKKRAADAEERNANLLQQVAKQDITIEQLRKEVSQIRSEMDVVQEKLVLREEELQASQNRVAEGLVTISQKEAAIITLRRELGKFGRFQRKGQEDTGNGVYSAETLQVIAADVEGRTQEARMKLTLADLEAKLSRVQQEKDYILQQHNQYLRHAEKAIACHEIHAMEMEDFISGHECVTTPYFYTTSFMDRAQHPEKYTTLLASEDAARVVPPPPDASLVSDELAKFQTFHSISFEAKRALERLSRISIDPTSQMKDELYDCIKANALALQSAAELVGFLSTFEQEVTNTRLTMHELREQWRKARVPMFVSSVAEYIGSSVTNLGKSLVQLLHRENEYTTALMESDQQRHELQRLDHLYAMQNGLVTQQHIGTMTAFNGRDAFVQVATVAGEGGQSEASPSSIGGTHHSTSLEERLSMLAMYTKNESTQTEGEGYLGGYGTGITDDDDDVSFVFPDDEPVPKISAVLSCPHCQHAIAPQELAKDEDELAGTVGADPSAPRTGTSRSGRSIHTTKSGSARRTSSEYVSDSEIADNVQATSKGLISARVPLAPPSSRGNVSAQRGRVSIAQGGGAGSVEIPGLKASPSGGNIDRTHRTASVPEDGTTKETKEVELGSTIPPSAAKEGSSRIFLLSDDDSESCPRDHSSGISPARSNSIMGAEQLHVAMVELQNSIRVYERQRRNTTSELKELRDFKSSIQTILQSTSGNTAQAVQLMAPLLQVADGRLSQQDRSATSDTRFDSTLGSMNMRDVIARMRSTANTIQKAASDDPAGSSVGDASVAGSLPPIAGSTGGGSSGQRILAARRAAKNSKTDESKAMHEAALHDMRSTFNQPPPDASFGSPPRVSLQAQLQDWQARHSTSSDPFLGSTVSHSNFFAAPPSSRALLPFDTSMSGALRRASQRGGPGSDSLSPVRDPPLVVGGHINIPNHQPPAAPGRRPGPVATTSSGRYAGRAPVYVQHAQDHRAARTSPLLMPSVDLGAGYGRSQNPNFRGAPGLVVSGGGFGFPSPSYGYPSRSAYGRGGGQGGGPMGLQGLGLQVFGFGGQSAAPTITGRGGMPPRKVLATGIGPHNFRTFQQYPRTARVPLPLHEAQIAQPWANRASVSMERIYSNSPVYSASSLKGHGEDSSAMGGQALVEQLIRAGAHSPARNSPMWSRGNSANGLAPHTPEELSIVVFGGIHGSTPSYARQRANHRPWSGMRGRRNRRWSGGTRQPHRSRLFPGRLSGGSPFLRVPSPFSGQPSAPPLAGLSGHTLMPQAPPAPRPRRPTPLFAKKNVLGPRVKQMSYFRSGRGFMDANRPRPQPSPRGMPSMGALSLQPKPPAGPHAPQPQRRN